MDGHMSDHMNQEELTHWMHMRKFKRYFLYGELAYVIVLLFTLMFNFAVFMHLIVFQGIAIVVYLTIGWIFDRGDPIFKYKKRDTVWESITSVRITKLFLIRIFEAIVFATSVGVAITFLHELIADLFRKALKGPMADLIENTWLYGDFISVVLIAGIAISILQGSKKGVRICSLLTLIPLLILLSLQHEMLVPIIIGFITCACGIWLSYREKL